MSDNDRPQHEWGYNVVGYLSGNFGLAIAGRNGVESLLGTGRPVRVVDIDPGGSRHGLDASVAELTETRLTTPRRVNLFHMNPIEIAQFMGQWRGEIDLADPNVCAPFWELPLPPAQWTPIIANMNAVLAPTHFVEDACLTVLPRERVIHYPQAVFLPQGVQPDRARWSLDPDATIFIASFDVQSDSVRKNPWAAVDAFTAAFPSIAGVQLVLKAKRDADHPDHIAQLADLEARAAADPRIRVIREDLTYTDVLSLYASCDVLVSLHRSEGLGLHLMEAMSLGKVVVATGWSGNMDFMTAEDSVPVGYQLVPMQTTHPAYILENGREGQVWAEADLDDAAAALRRLHDDPELRARLGSAAAEAMEALRGSVRSGRAFDELESRLAGTRGLPGLRPAARRIWAARQVGRVRGKLGRLLGR